MSFKKVESVLSAAVATNGTFTVGYPTGTNSGSFTGTYLHKMWVAAHEFLYVAPTGFTVSFGASNITITYKGTTSIPANTRVNLQFDIVGDDSLTLPTGSANKTQRILGFIVNLGAPVAGAANNINTSAALTAAAGNTAPAGGTLVSGSVATMDVPRNIVAAWTGTAVLTITGTDEYGNVLKESSASGTSFTGKKAFATVTGVQTSADVTGLTVGTGNVLGLPVALPQAGLVLAEMQDGAKPTAGTIVSAVRSVATATTGDVRGTYAPNATPDASKAFSLVVALPDTLDKGVAQFAG